MEYPVPVIPMDETVIELEPVLEIVTVWDCVLLTVTLPKLSELALDDRVELCVAATPVPVRVTGTLGLEDALVLKVAVPFEVPAAVGAKTAV
jgi:hypothetical protein